MDKTPEKMTIDNVRAEINLREDLLPDVKPRQVTQVAKMVLDHFARGLTGSLPGVIRLHGELELYSHFNTKRITIVNADPIPLPK